MSDPTTTRPAATAVALDRGLAARPPATVAHDPIDPRPDPAVAHWEALLDADHIPNRNPPPAPDVLARRAANDALFRAIATDRRRRDRASE